MEAKEKFILVDPNDDSGNDNGIIDEKEMTQSEAYKLNEERRGYQSDCRWIKARPSGRYNSFYSETYYE